MQIDVMAEVGPVNFQPGTELEEILQNVSMVLTTRKGSVPMDRAFGIDGDILDLPSGVAQARMSAEIVAAIQRCEPRASVKRVIYAGDAEDGEVRATVRIEINESKLRGGVFL